MDKPKKTPKIVNIRTYIDDINSCLELLSEEIDRKKKNNEAGIRKLQKINNKLLILKKDAPKLKKRTYNRKSSKSYFSKECKVTNELSDFLGLDENQTVTRGDITIALCVYVNLKEKESRERFLKWEKLNPGGKRNLQDSKNRKIIIPDKKLEMLLGYKQFIEDVKNKKIKCKKTDKETKEKKEEILNDTNLYYSTMQKLIEKHVIH